MSNDNDRPSLMERASRSSDRETKPPMAKAEPDRLAELIALQDGVADALVAVIQSFALQRRVTEELIKARTKGTP